MIMATSLVNSVCHSDGRYGYRRFELNDGTTNELVTTILTVGEGLHNNHHHFPRDAYLSHAWYEIDINGLIILGLGKLGLVHDIFTGGARQGALGAERKRNLGDELLPYSLRGLRNRWCACTEDVGDARFVIAESTSPSDTR
jgi:stearoyl-CoA desaturase (delta-9 desaturase)